MTTLMPVSKAYVQKWECMTCHNTYEAPIRVYEVLCPTSHFVNQKHMVLVEGTLPERNQA